MVSQCANPECSCELHYLRDGKIYLFDLSAQCGGRRREYFWLCGKCSKTMVLARLNQWEIQVLLQSHRISIDPRNRSEGLSAIEKNTSTVVRRRNV
jgi:hypothetical protein